MNSGSYGAGVGTGLAIGMAAQAAAEDEDRRKSHQGDDQILIKIKGSYDAAVKVLTDIYEWKIDTNGDLVWANPGYSYFGAFLGFIIFGVILFISENIVELTSIGFPLSLIILVVISIAVGYFVRDDTIDWFDIDEDNGVVIIQITKYDSSGYRNIDEKDIFKIIERLKGAKLL